MQCPFYTWWIATSLEIVYFSHSGSCCSAVRLLYFHTFSSALSTFGVLQLHLVHCFYKPVTRGDNYCYHPQTREISHGSIFLSPITLTNFTCKIMKRMVNRQWQTFFNLVTSLILVKVASKLAFYSRKPCPGLSPHYIRDDHCIVVFPDIATFHADFLSMRKISVQLQSAHAVTHTSHPTHFLIMTSEIFAYSPPEVHALRHISRVSSDAGCLGFCLEIIPLLWTSSRPC